MRRAMKVALRREGQFLRKQIVQGLRKQAPGGKKLEPPSRATLAIRKFQGFRGRKSLIRSGDLIGSITVLLKGDGVFIGVLKTKRTDTGKSMVNVARIQEFGSRPIVIKMTPKMRRFLFAAFAAAGIKESAGGGGGKGIIVTRVPARPWLAPVFEEHAKPAQIGPRMMDRMAIALGGQFGKPRKRPSR